MRLVFLTTAALTALTLTACSTPPPPVKVSGTFTLRDRWIGNLGDPCSGDGGYSDIQPGAQVVVSDAAGKTLALGRLGVGELVLGRLGHRDVDCSFPFTVADVPPGHAFYGVEVTRRGRLQYTPAQLARPLELTLGR